MHWSTFLVRRPSLRVVRRDAPCGYLRPRQRLAQRSEEHTSELQSQSNLVCRLLLEKKKTHKATHHSLALQLLTAARFPAPRDRTDAGREPTLHPTHTCLAATIYTAAMWIVALRM